MTRSKVKTGSGQGSGQKSECRSQNDPQEKPPRTPRAGQKLGKETGTARVCAVVVGQGDLPRAMLDAARAIVPDSDGVVAVSNLDCSASALPAMLEQAVRDLPAGDVVIFADMFGTSCANAGRDVKQKHAHITVICGTNLPMLVRFLYHRDRKPFAELIPFLVETGRTAVQTIEI